MQIPNIRYSGNYPQVWYIQVDGGSENANKYVLAALEFLVLKRVVQRIILTSRLPVGHTHEDIDAYFGTIASWFQRNIIQTPQDYKQQIENAFDGSADSKMKCNVEDVFVVPNYQSFFGESIDKNFGRMHKRKWTQHQYRFEAVTISN